MKTKKFEYLFEAMNFNKIMIVANIIFVIIAAIIIYFQKYVLLLLPVILAIFFNSMFRSVLTKQFNLIKNKKNILKHGQEYEGRIIGYKTIPLLSELISVSSSVTEMTKNVDSDTWILVIEYNNKTFETPAIVYNPTTFFASDKCTVYSNGEIEYATSFDVAVDDNFYNIPKIEPEETNESENN